MNITSFLLTMSKIVGPLSFGRATSLGRQHWIQNQPEKGLAPSDCLVLGTPTALAAVHVLLKQTYNRLYYACICIKETIHDKRNAFWIFFYLIYPCTCLLFIFYIILSSSSNLNYFAEFNIAKTSRYLYALHIFSQSAQKCKAWPLNFKEKKLLSLIISFNHLLQRRLWKLSVSVLFPKWGVKADTAFNSHSPFNVSKLVVLITVGERYLVRDL